MKSKILGLLAVVLLAGSASANALIVDFDTQPEAYVVSPITDSGFSFTLTAEGFGTNNISLWPSNGTVHLMSWTNSGSSSGFTVAALNGSPFSISSFLFGSGYLDGSLPVTSLTVSGTGGTGPFTQTFTSGIDYFDFGPGLALLTLSGGNTATQYTFTAYGAGNRAQFDNLIIDMNPVPEPSTLALLGLGLAGLGLSRRRNGLSNNDKRTQR